MPSQSEFEQLSVIARRRLLKGMGSAPLLALLPGCGGGNSDAESNNATTSASNVTDASAADSTATVTSSTTTTSTVETPSTSSSSAQQEAATEPSPAAATAFIHPGLMHTEADFARMRAKVTAKAQPWLDGWNALNASGRASISASPNPLETVVRGGTGENFRTMVEDLERAYQFALHWKVSGDVAHADRAVLFLNAWSSTMKTLAGNADRFLAAGIYGYQWANAAEIMRTYSGWKAEDIAQFQKLLLEVFYPLSHTFLITHNNANITNYWANWDLCSIAGILAIGVFCDRRDIYDEAIAYYKTGRGNGAAAHNVYYLHPGHFGQWQESGRDQGHATLGMALGGLLCEMAWNQGDDLYGLNNNRFLAGAEYVAKSNLKDSSGNFYTLPFSTYANRQGNFTGLSSAGRPNYRPCWEVIYNHYVNRKGLSAPYIAAIAAQLRPERAEWGGDQPSFGTLTFSRDPIDKGVAPSGLTAYVTAGAVLLSWWGTAYATSYNVQRASTSSGPFTTVASGILDPRTYTDSPGNGAWYYRVIAVTPTGETSPSSTMRVALASELRTRLPLDGGSGTTSVDVTGSGRNGTLVGGAGWGAGRIAGKSAVSLDGKTGHVALPSGVVSDLGDFTIALWVYWNATQTNTRVFDFGSSDIAYMSLMPRDSGGHLKFMVTGTTYFGEQSLVAASALPTGRWVHLAVTLSGTVGTLYMDGTAVATNEAIALAPFQLGTTTQNWLGRSQYSADPYFKGRLEDLQILSGALGAKEIAALAAS